MPLPIDAPSPATDAWPHRLAARVITQAFKDLLKQGPAADYASAREFLAGSAMLRYWCHVGALDADSIICGADSLTRLHAQLDESSRRRRRDITRAIARYTAKAAPGTSLRLVGAGLTASGV